MCFLEDIEQQFSIIDVIWLLESCWSQAKTNH